MEERQYFFLLQSLSEEERIAECKLVSLME